MKTAISGLIVAALAMPALGQLAPGVRGVATRAPLPMKIDGDLSEWGAAFCTQSGRELTRVAPSTVNTGMKPGY